MENIDSVKHLLRPGDFMATIIYLKDAYFSAPIGLRDRKYLRFLWDNALYEFTCLPFGHSLAPRVWRISRDLDLTVVHIPDLMNTKADFNSN